MQNDGGPAFPTPESHGDDFEGMSLRDYFAAHCPSDLAEVRVKADREMLAGKEPTREEGGVLATLFWNATVEARLRYIYADAMLKARLL